MTLRKISTSNIKKFCELVRETYGPFFPTSRKKRKAFLDKVREKVEYYKPRIEDKCEISLGEINVKDNKEWLSDILYSFAHKKVVKDALEQKRIPTTIDFHASFIGASVVEALTAGPIWLYDSIRGTDFRQDRSTIYVPFYYANRSMDVDFKKRTERIDYGVVHELSHVLWDKISGDIDGYLGEGRKWFEGFATYCADNYFADFYPNGTEKSFDLSKVYTDGKKRIEELVAREGKEVLLKIPRKWEEFSNNNS